MRCFTMPGEAEPMVSAITISPAPAACMRRARRSTSASGVSPSNGQSKATAT